MLDPRCLVVVAALAVALVVALQRRERRMGGIDSYDGNSLRSKPAPLTWRETSPYVVCYTLYALLVLLAIVVAFTWSSTIVALLGAFVSSREWRGMLYIVGNIVVVFGFGIVAFAAEAYLRAGIGRGQLVRRFVQVGVSVALAGGLGVLVRTMALAVLKSRPGA